MKERPALFNGPMVCALLREVDPKTQSRRMVRIPDFVKGDPADYDTMAECNDATTIHWEPAGGDFKESGFRAWMTEYPDEGAIQIDCPYGKVGDRLWVREAWRIGAWDEGLQAVAVDYIADGFIRDEWIRVEDIEKEPEPGSIFTRRTTFERLQQQSLSDAKKDGIVPDENGCVKWEKSCSPCRIRPSIHMPRWASRILLEITGVRVERLQDISPDDAIAEGLKAITKDGKLIKYGIPDLDGYPGTDNTGWPWEEWRTSPVDAYRKLWETINGTGSWAANPWVWVIEFKVVNP